MENCELFHGGSTGMRPIIRRMSSIVTMDLLITRLEKMLKSIRKKLIMVGIHKKKLS